MFGPVERADIIANQNPHRLGDTYAQAGMEALLLDTEGALDVTFRDRKSVV
jgi:hypothetical protein